MLERVLEHMYQSWMQGNSAYIHDWMRFVELVSKHFSVTTEKAIEELEKYKWFKKGER